MKRAFAVATLAVAAIAAVTIAVASGRTEAERGFIPVVAITETRGETKLLSIRAAASQDSSYLLTEADAIDVVQGLVSTRSNPDTVADGAFWITNPDGSRLLELSVGTNSGTKAFDFKTPVPLRAGDRIVFLTESGEPSSGSIVLLGAPAAAAVTEAFTVR